MIYLTVREWAAAHRVSPSHAYNLVRTGAIPVLRVGKRFLIPRDLAEEQDRSAMEGPRVGRDRQTGP